MQASTHKPPGKRINLDNMAAIKSYAEDNLMM